MRVHEGSRFRGVHEGSRFRGVQEGSRLRGVQEGSRFRGSARFRRVHGWFFFWGRRLKAGTAQKIALSCPNRAHHIEPSAETVVSDHIVHVGDIAVCPW